MEELEGRNVPVPVESVEVIEPKPRFVAGDVMPNGTVFDPERHKIFKNGTVYDMDAKRIIVAPSPEHAPINSSNAKAIAQKRWDTAREAFAEGMAVGMGKKAPTDAWGAIGRKAAELLNETKSVRGFADLARFTGEASGAIPMARGREEMQEQPTEQTSILVLIQQFVQTINVNQD